MKCVNHIERDAVSQCTECGKGLCLECTNLHEYPLCSSCNSNHNKMLKKTFIKNILLMVILFIWGFKTGILKSGDTITDKLLLGYLWAGVPWGWSVLNRITPSVFLFLPVIGWVFYFLFKLVVSMLVGAFITPFKIFQSIKGLNGIKEGEGLNI